MWCMSSSTHNKKDTEEYFRDMLKKRRKKRSLCSVTMPEIRNNHQSRCQRPQQHVNINEVNFLTLTKWRHISLLVKLHLSKKENMKLIGYIKQPHLHCIFAQHWNTIVWNVNNNNKLLEHSKCYAYLFFLNIYPSPHTRLIKWQVCLLLLGFFVFCNKTLFLMPAPK